MKWYEIFILSVMEMVGLFIIWESIDERFNKNIFKKGIIIFIIATLIAIFNQYKLDKEFIIVYFGIFTLCIKLFKVSFKEVFFAFLISFGIVMIIEMISTYILILIVKNNYYTFINGLFINSVVIICAFFIKRYSIINNIKKILNTNNSIISIVFLNIISLTMGFLYMWYINNNLISDNDPIKLIGIFIWILVNFFMIYQAISLKEKKEELFIHEKYIPYVTELVEEARRKQHDYSNHLNSIYGITETEKPENAIEEINKYLKGLIKNFKSLDKILSIKDPVLSAIIYSKRALAESKNIDFKFNVKNEIPEYKLEKYELVEILGNLIDNAIEAVEDGEKAIPKEVSITLGTKENKNLIEVKNTGKTIPFKHMKSIFEKGFSTKEGKHRGYGLYNVKKIVNKYNGTIELSLEDQYTAFNILF